MRLPVLFAAAVLAGALATAASAKVVVSSKIDTEGGVLGNVIALALKANGIEVEDRIQLGGTPIVRKAITGGRDRHLSRVHRQRRLLLQQGRRSDLEGRRQGLRGGQEARLRRQQDRLADALAGQQHLGDRAAQGSRGLGEADRRFPTSASGSPAAARSSSPPRRSSSIPPPPCRPSRRPMASSSRPTS